MTTHYRRQLAYPERIESRMYRLTMDRRSPGYGTFSWRPPTNVFETDSGMVVQVEVAGLGRGDYRVDYGDGCLTIAGSRRLATAFGSPTACHQVEIAGGNFCTEIDVPWSADGDRIEADYRDGFILVRLPKRGT